MKSTARIIEVDFVNHRRRTQGRNALESIGKHTAKFEAHMKKVEARRQERIAVQDSCKNLKNYVNALMKDIGADKSAKDNLEETLAIGAAIFCTTGAGCIATCFVR